MVWKTLYIINEETGNKHCLVVHEDEYETTSRQVAMIETPEGTPQYRIYTVKSLADSLDTPEATVIIPTARIFEILRASATECPYCRENAVQATYNESTQGYESRCGNCGTYFFEES